MKNDFFQKIIDSRYPYIIAEIGANHNGDMALAKEMIDSAKSCGCDAVKFQSWTPKSLIAKEEYDRNQEYNDSKKKHFGSLKEMVEAYYLRKEQHFELKKYCDDIKIDFASSPFSPDEVDLLVELKVPFLKVASMDINHPILLKKMASTGLPILISTGMATLSEIESAVNTIKGEGNEQIVLLHCISIYPPDYKDINMLNIPMLQQTFRLPVGFSDHTIGTSIPLASVVLGSKVIEKHFTIDKDLPGWDHEISADPCEMKTIVSESRNIIDSLGTHCRIVSTAEQNKKDKFRRSIVWSRNMKKGEIISNEDLDFKRPGTGIEPSKFNFLIGKKTKSDFEIDTLVHWEDIE